jgi:hypothetical protein
MSTPSPHKSFSVRIPRLKREAAAYIILRRKGYTINKLSEIFGRSTSFIHRILKAVGLAGSVETWIGSGYCLAKTKVLNKLDQRKCLRAKKYFWGKKYIALVNAWLDFMDGEGERPP